MFRRRHVVVGVADRSGYVAPVSRHWTQSAAESAKHFYKRHRPPGYTFHVVTR